MDNLLSCFPYKIATFTERDKPWITPLIKTLKTVAMPLRTFHAFRLHFFTRNYLHNRSQRVRIASNHSDLVPITSGVPQGSLLGPFLFCIFVSNLSALNEPVNVIIKFADDSALIAPTLKDDSDRLNILDEHQNVLNWSERHKLPINAQKCSIISFSNHPTFTPTEIPTMKRTNTLKYLGITFTFDLKWKIHVNTIIKRASSTLYILRSLKPYLSKKKLKTIYYYYTRSIMEYANPLFVGLGVTEQSRLHSLQKRIHKLICGSQCTTNCLDNLTTRRNNHSIRLFRKALSPMHVLHDIMPHLSNRSSRVIIPYCRTTNRLRSFVPYTSILYNS